MLQASGEVHSWFSTRKVKYYKKQNSDSKQDKDTQLKKNDPELRD